MGVAPQCSIPGASSEAIVSTQYTGSAHEVRGGQSEVAKLFRRLTDAHNCWHYGITTAGTMALQQLVLWHYYSWYYGITTAALWHYNSWYYDITTAGITLRHYNIWYLPLAIVGDRKDVSCRACAQQAHAARGITRGARDGGCRVENRGGGGPTSRTNVSHPIACLMHSEVRRHLGHTSRKLPSQHT